MRGFPPVFRRGVLQQGGAHHHPLLDSFILLPPFGFFLTPPSLGVLEEVKKFTKKKVIPKCALLFW